MNMQSRMAGSKSAQSAGSCGGVVGLVVRARPERLAALRDAIEAIPAAEVHAAADGRLVVTLEDSPQLSVSEALVRVQQLDHVICVTLAYEHSAL